MLSKANSDRINMDAIYSCEPKEEYRDRLFKDDLFWCCNWVFEPIETDSEIYMRDTYWQDRESVHILVTDENIDEFKIELIKSEVKQINEEDSYKYDNVIEVAIGSGGWQYSTKYFVKK